MAANRAGFKTAINNLNAQMRSGSGITDSDYTDGLESAIYNYIISFTVASTVSVTSVSGITSGPSVSGPGSGTATGTLS